MTALPVIRNGIPLINYDGTPALCKVGGCCGGSGETVNCSVCDATQVPKYLLVTIDTAWRDGVNPDCENCVGCSVLQGMSFMVPFTGSHVAGPVRWCDWYSVFDIYATSCVFPRAIVTVTLRKDGTLPVTLRVEILISGQYLGPPCGSYTGADIASTQNVEDLPGWTCDSMAARLPVGREFEGPPPGGAGCYHNEGFLRVAAA